MFEASSSGRSARLCRARPLCLWLSLGLVLAAGCQSAQPKVGRAPGGAATAQASARTSSNELAPSQRGPVATSKPEAARDSQLQLKQEPSTFDGRADAPAVAPHAPAAARALPPPSYAAAAKSARSSESFGAGGLGLTGVGQGAGGLGLRKSAGLARGGMHSATRPLSAFAQAPATAPSFNSENYAHVDENAFIAVKDEALSTFSIDVDSASYANSRRFLREGQMPPADAVRVEEWVNYFPYEYAAPSDNEPFAVHSEVASCPWNEQHRLVRIGIKGRVLEAKQVPPQNLVFLIDVSGSMMTEDRLPLLKRGLAGLVRTLRPEDRVAMVVYAGSTGLVLPSTSGREQGRILAALGMLEAGGSTNGADGIRLAYDVAQRSFIKGGVNRVILATDGDFNVGTTSQGELVRLIEEKRKSSVFLSVLGFGRGNRKDATMEQLADKGNGNYAYVDSLAEANKVLVREAGGTLVTIAKDVKLQVEFNPKRVQSYKLIGYENRLLAKQDFNDDSKDAGEIGAGHSVTAFYEIVPVGAKPARDAHAVDPLKYQSAPAPNARADSDELMTINVRYKLPASDTSTKFSRVVQDSGNGFAQASTDFRFAAAVANFALMLRAPESVKSTSFKSLRSVAESALGADRTQERHEFVELIDSAAALSAPAPSVAIAH